MNTPARTADAIIRQLRALPALLIAILLSPGSAHAMTYMPMADASLFDQADAVVLAKVSAVEAVPGRELDATRYQLAIDETVKGALPGAALALDLPGALNRTLTGALQVPGTPEFSVAERMLLFLHRRADGSYAVAQLPLGAFHVRAAADGTEVLVRELAVADVAPGNTGAPSYRDLRKFETWLFLRTAGLAASDDYWHAGPLADTLHQEKFATQGSPPARWFEFDNGGSVTFYAGSTGQQGLPGGGYGQFQQALDAWNADPASTVRIIYGGITAAAGGLAHHDGVNQIVFNDPFGDIGGTFDCVHGGTIGYTGFRTGPVRTLGGTSFRPIIEADVVIQDGAACILGAHGGSAGAELMAHELGHALGLAHPCGDSGTSPCMAGTPADDALMRGAIHDDGRGAALRADDRLAAGYLYSMTTAVGVPLPAVGGGGGGNSPDQQVDANSSSKGSGSSDSSGGSRGGALNRPTLGLLLLGLLWRRRRAQPKTTMHWRDSAAREPSGAHTFTSWLV